MIHIKQLFILKMRGHSPGFVLKPDGSYVSNSAGNLIMVQPSGGKMRLWAVDGG